MNREDKPWSTGSKFALFIGFVVVWVGLCIVLHKVMPAFRKGGWGMWPILGAGMIFVGVTIERAKYLFFRAKTDHKQFFAEIQKDLLQGDVKRAVDYCRTTPAPLPNIVGAGLSSLHRTDEDVQDAVDEAALYELPQIEKRTGYLAMLGNIATLLGLLGTIVGLIKSFAGVSLETVNDKNIARAQQYVHLVPQCEGLQGRDVVTCISQNKATILAAGISEAMNCTAFGLLVGILSLLAFSALNGRTQSLIDEISHSAVALVNLAVSNKKLMNL